MTRGLFRVITWFSLLVSCVILAHAFLIFASFPTLSSIVDRDAPIVTVDHALHLYHGVLGARFLREAGTTWGFDPFFMAGYPETPVWDSSSNLAILSQVLAGGGASPRAYKLAVLTSGLLVVPVLIGTAALIRVRPAEQVLGWIYFWGGVSPVHGGLARMTETWLGLYGRLTTRQTFVVGLRPEMRALVETLRKTTDGSARILFEDQLRLLEVTDPENTHWTPLLPTLLKPHPRQFLGGLYHGAFIAHYQGTAFGDFHLAGRPIVDWTPRELDWFTARYNVGWLVCWSPLARFVFDQYAPARRIATVPRWHTPGVLVPAAEEQWQAIPAAGRSVQANRYVFDEGNSQYAVYRLDTWQTDPPLPLERVPLAGDPVGFVRIRLPGPLKRVKIENRYGPDRSESVPKAPKGRP